MKVINNTSSLPVLSCWILLYLCNILHHQVVVSSFSCLAVMPCKQIIGRPQNQERHNDYYFLLTNTKDNDNILYRQKNCKNNNKSVILHAEKSQKTKGVYVRPSGAIERGSGFFVPGLEGSRVRLVFGSVLLLLTGINHFINNNDIDGSGGLAVEETLAVVYSLLVLLQAAIEFGKEDLGIVVSDSGKNKNDGSASSSSDKEKLSQTWDKSSIDATDEWQERVQWVAASYLSMTPATHMMLLGKPNQIVYRLGSTTMAARNNNDNIAAGVEAAFETISNSKGGRVSLPSSHPAVLSLVPEAHNRAVVLQRIDDKSCLLISSDQLLAGFTSQDLKWLGQMAQYVARSQ